MSIRGKRKKIKKTKITQLPSGRYVYPIILLFSFLLYANTLGHQYTLDDAILITENTFTKQGFRGISDIFSHDTFYGFFNKEGKDQLVSGGRYRPFTHALFAIEYAIFGLNPFWGHLLNILYYSFLNLSIFLILFYLLKRFLKNDHLTWKIVLGTCLFFAVHPIHTEVVANIKGRDELCALLASLWALYFSLRGWREKRHLFSILSGILFLIGLFSKENAIMFLLIIPLSAWLFFRVTWKETGWVGIPPLLATMIYLLIRYSVLGGGFSENPSTELMNNPFLYFDGNVYRQMTITEKWPLILTGLGKSIELLFFPHPLTHDYYPRQFALVSLMHWKVVLTTIIYLLILIGVPAFWKHKPLYSFAFLYFLLTLFLTSNILFPIGTHFSERFLFMPSLGFCLVICYFFFSHRKIGNKKWFYFSMLLVTAVMAMKTISRNRVWKDNFTLFTTDVRTSHQSAKAQNAAGGALITRAQAEKDSIQKTEYLREAVDHLDQAISIHPLYKNAYLLKGNALFYLKDYDLAIAHFDQALKIAPDYKDALLNRAITYRDFGRYKGETLGNLPAAIEYLEKALEVIPDDYESNRLAAIAYGNYGVSEKSIQYFEKAVSLNPNDGWTFYNLGMAYLNQGDTIQARRNLIKAKELNPEIPLK